ncbi:MAG: N-acetylmuramic acid 6-phosphate etherase [Burkholderiales bacterium]|nr:N-acetylmuramic acid 6-phosphate etherase [Burkholderiales bacterium]
MLATERPSADHVDLDTYPVEQLVAALAADQARAATAVQRAGADLARAVASAVPRIKAGGRLIYAGAGTSGRLGLLDSVELYPTFAWPAERSLALLAGGAGAVYRAVEGAEDNAEQGALDVSRLAPTANDVVIGIAASGTTPYVLGALRAAREAGALTIGIANNADSPVCAQAHVGVTLDTGPEMVSGSTRLKAGTAQKIALNTFSTALMVRLHKVYGNLMVDLVPTNAKLLARAIRLTALATGAEESVAESALKACRYRVKTAIVMIVLDVDALAAQQRLADNDGDVRAALAR